jgi:hypothetical protein
MASLMRQRNTYAISCANTVLIGQRFSSGRTQENCPLAPKAYIAYAIRAERFRASASCIATRIVLIATRRSRWKQRLTAATFSRHPHTPSCCLNRTVTSHCLASMVNFLFYFLVEQNLLKLPNIDS